jgi:hypothetical protein
LPDIPQVFIDVAHSDSEVKKLKKKDEEDPFKHDI